MILEDSKGLEKIIEYSKKGSKMSMEYSKDSDKIPICLNFVDLVIVLQKVGTKLLVFARSYNSVTSVIAVPKSTQICWLFVDLVMIF